MIYPIDNCLKHCILRQDSKTRLQEEVNQKKLFSFLMLSPTKYEFGQPQKLMIIGWKVVWWNKQKGRTITDPAWGKLEKVDTKIK